MKWIIDPKTEKPSVSLTLLVLATSLFITLGIFEVVGLVKSVGVFVEFLYTTCALYFGRKLDFNNLFNKKK
jgi:hypothetical protein